MLQIFKESLVPRREYLKSSRKAWFQGELTAQIHFSSYLSLLWTNFDHFFNVAREVLYNLHLTLTSYILQFTRCQSQSPRNVPIFELSLSLSIPRLLQCCRPKSAHRFLSYRVDRPTDIHFFSFFAPTNHARRSALTLDSKFAMFLDCAKTMRPAHEVIRV